MNKIKPFIHKNGDGNGREVDQIKSNLFLKQRPLTACRHRLLAAGLCAYKLHCN